MLSNPHWDAPSFSSFEHWLEGKDPSEKYNYADCTNCACAQYLRAVGKYDDRFWLSKAIFGDAVSQMNYIASGDLSRENDDRGDTFSGDLSRENDRGHTFGQLLDRVRAHKQLVAV